MNVLVTGHKGYIGAHLVDLLKQEGHLVTGVDLGLFDGCEWSDLVTPDNELCKDIRALSISDLDGHQAIMHLAAISNDAMGEISPSLTCAVNRNASIRLAQLAKDAGVSRFLFASSCSIYGKGRSSYLDESAPLNPLTAYAESKITTEIEVGKLADEGFSPTFLRNATAFGSSPMLRIDLVVNNLLACAYTRGDIRIMSDGTPWRPLIHCKDIARAFVACLEAPRKDIHNLAINIGSNEENYQVKDVAELVNKLIPEAKIVFTGEIGKDPRDYCVSFELLGKVLPDFRLSYDLESGTRELFHHFVDRQFAIDDFVGPQFLRLKMLKNRLDLLEETP